MEAIPSPEEETLPSQRAEMETIPSPEEETIPSERAEMETIPSTHPRRRGDRLPTRQRWNRFLLRRWNRFHLGAPLLS